jgi:choline dehydrogenase-like flavoprotein
MMGTPISPPNTKAEPEAFQSAVLEGTARFRSSVAKRENPRAERPDVVMHFMPLYYAPKSAPIQYSLQGEPWPLSTNAYTLLVTLGETEAQGSLAFHTGAPDVSPVVTHDPLTARDREVAAEAVQLARRIGGSSEFSQPTQFVENNAGEPDMFTAVYDGRGTCRMGNDERTSVVNFNLQVHGVERLRIVDGSVIPQGSPYLAVPEVLALAERAADLILGRQREQSHKIAPIAPTVPLSALTASFGRHTTLSQAVSHLKFITSDTGLAHPAGEIERPSVPLIAGFCLCVLMLTALAKVLLTSFSKKISGPGSESLLA